PSWNTYADAAYQETGKTQDEATRQKGKTNRPTVQNKVNHYLPTKHGHATSPPQKKTKTNITPNRQGTHSSPNKQFKYRRHQGRGVRKTKLSPHARPTIP